jgi:hypothetical protein
MPLFALDFWYRWMLMLVYPFTFYAANGITKILRLSRTAISTLRCVGQVKPLKIAVRLILILPFSAGLISAAAAMQGRSVPYSDVENTIKAMQWLNSRMDNGSVLVTHITFFNWARLYLDEKHTLIYFEDDVEKAVGVALQGFNDVYFVWWNESVDWHDFKVPNGFVSVFDSGRISVFMYNVSGV